MKKGPELPGPSSLPQLIRHCQIRQVRKHFVQHRITVRVFCACGFQRNGNRRVFFDVQTTAAQTKQRNIEHETGVLGRTDYRQTNVGVRANSLNRCDGRKVSGNRTADFEVTRRSIERTQHADRLVRRNVVVNRNVRFGNVAEQGGGVRRRGVVNGHLDSVNVRRSVVSIFAGRRHAGSAFLFVAGVAAAISVVARNKRKVGVQLVGLRNVQRKFVRYCAFQIFALRTVQTFAQGAFDLIRTTLDKRRGLFVLDNSSDEKTNRLAGSGFVDGLPSYVVENKRLRCNRLNAGIAHIISEAVCRRIAADEDPTTGEQFGHGRKVASGNDKRNDVAGYGNVRVCGGKLATDAFQLRACGRGFVNQGFSNNDARSGSRNDGFKAVVRRVGKAGRIYQHIGTKHAKPGSCGVSAVDCGNAGKRDRCAVKRLRRRKFARVCEEEALQNSRKVCLRKVGVEAARCVKVGNRAFLVLARRVDRRAGNGRKFAAEVRIAVGFQSVPNGRRRKLLLSCSGATGR
ncbi:hypothetical protein PSV3_00218 [Septimatrevirus PSV33]|uniref:Uncharacterized protein n=1 Tax=Pseudomonas phage PSV3 TaxID=3003632 RepID=A0AAE9VW57_9CAUD|nr:hypothetical protein PM406_gp19 [Pseudomonas phage PSV3]WBF76920.1 hypothetical protein PSV3_00218 [Pseudomonas phage PSV3]